MDRQQTKARRGRSPGQRHDGESPVIKGAGGARRVAPTKALISAGAETGRASRRAPRPKRNAPATPSSPPPLPRTPHRAIPGRGRRARDGGIAPYAVGASTGATAEPVGHSAEALAALVELQKAVHDLRQVVEEQGQNHPPSGDFSHAQTEQRRRRVENRGEFDGIGALVVTGLSIKKLQEVVCPGSSRAPDGTSAAPEPAPNSSSALHTRQFSEPRFRRVVHSLSISEVERLIFYLTFYREDPTYATQLLGVLLPAFNASSVSSSSTSDSATPAEYRIGLVVFECRERDRDTTVQRLCNAITDAGGTVAAGRSGRQSSVTSRARQLSSRRTPGSSHPLFFTTDPLELAECRAVLLDDRGWNLIKRGNIRPYLTAPGRRALTRLIQLRMWLHRHFTPAEREQFLLIGSSTLFMYGVRLPGDIDLYIHNPTADPAFVSKVEQGMAVAPAGLFAGVDVIMRGYGGWVEAGGEYAEALSANYLFDWPAAFGAGTMDTVITGRQFHEFFMGLKCVSLVGDIVRRVRRIRPAAYADLIAMSRNPSLSTIVELVIPRLTEYIFEEKQWVRLDEGSELRFFGTIQNYLKSRYGISMKGDEIAELLKDGVVVEPFRYLVGAVAGEGMVGLTEVENQHGAVKARDVNKAPRQTIPSNRHVGDVSENRVMPTKRLMLVNSRGKGHVVVLRRVS